MIVKNNYKECLTNLACSIRKYFDLEYHHNTIDYIDKELEEYQPKNVILFLFDGMGSNILDRMLPENSFFRKNKIKAITTVFPATTVAATTSVATGLNPKETGMLGWDMYYKDLDKTITVFLNSEKGDPNHVELQEAKDYKKQHMKTKTITEEINEMGKYKGYAFSQFEDRISFTDLDDLMKQIEEVSKDEGKKFIYAYDMEPDTSMHALGCDKEAILKLIWERNNKVELLSRKLEDSIIIVIADHGHLNVDNINLEEYHDLVDCLKRNTSLEPRATNFFIQEDKKEIFQELFQKYFKEDFDLYPMEEVLSSELFGDGEENEILQDALGDYLAIGKTNKALLYQGNKALKSTHAGYTEDEILVPLILTKTRKYNPYCHEK